MSSFCFRLNLFRTQRIWGICGLILCTVIFCGCCQECSTSSPDQTKPTEQQTKPTADASPSEPSPVQAAVDAMKSDVPVTLESCGAKVDLNKDGSVKAVDFSNAKLLATSVFSAADLGKLSSARVVRGRGPIFPTVFKACEGMNRLTEFLWTEAAAEAANFKFFSSKGELKKVRLTGLKTDSIAEILKTLGASASLVDLDVSGSTLADTDLAVFATGGFKKLTRLNLYQTGTTNHGVESLLPLAGQLVWLNLDATAVTDDGCKNIGKFKSLTFLHLGRTMISDAAAES
ncbi:MAG: hypothetical protein Q4G59_00865, partial [Planctomycetia bacterium]|nr:hypothetical protein [Planctomycetia bacterium]